MKRSASTTPKFSGLNALILRLWGALIITRRPEEAEDAKENDKNGEREAHTPIGSALTYAEKHRRACKCSNEEPRIGQIPLWCGLR